jgi:hypothetical protein
MFTWLAERCRAAPALLEPAVFLHIQKTAGTSLVHLAARHYGNENIITHGEYVGRTPESLANIPFVSGHFGFDYAKTLIKTRMSFTFLRDPAERILSLYHFYRTQDPDTFPMYRIAHESSLAEFLRKGLEDPMVRSRIWNNQTWQLAHGYGCRDKREIPDFSPQALMDLAMEHLQDFTFIGLVERFERDAALVAQALGWPSAQESIRENARPRSMTVSDYTAEEKFLMEELTALDMLLYEHVKTTMYQNLRTNML